MPDGPKKQKKGPVAAAQPAGPAVNSAPEPTWDINAYDHPTDTTAEGSAPDAQPEQHPVASWWDRVTNAYNQGASAIPFVKEAARSAARGAIGAVNETAQTVFEGGAALARHTGLGELESPGYNAAYDEAGAKGLVGDAGVVSQENVDKYLGKRSDNKLAQFAESATQFATSFATLGGVEMGGVKLAEMGAGAALARGAVTDLTAFDPYEAQLAELAARSPVPGLKQLGQVLSVGQDDGPMVARLKRAAAGVLTGAAMDGLISGARIIRAKRALAEGATGAEKSAAEATIESDSKVVDAVADGTHTSPEDPFVVEKSGDNGWTIKPNPENEAAKGLGMLDGEAPRDITFTDRAAAEAQAASAGQSANQRWISQHAVDVQDADKFTSTLSDLLTKNDTDGLRSLMDDSDHFNVSYYTGPKEALAAIETHSKLWGQAIDAAQARGAQTVPELIDRARRVLGSLDETSAPRFFGKKLAQQKDQAVFNLAADSYMRMLGKNVADLGMRYEANKGDPILLKDASTAIGNLFEIQKGVAAANSEWGRTGRLMQERGTTALADAKLGDKALGSAAAGDAAPNAAAQSADATAAKVAGMDTRSIEQYLKAARIADGDVTNLYAIGHLATRKVHTGVGDKFMELFANFLLSRPVTSATQVLSGASVGAFETAGRMLAGVATGNSALAREGADMLYSHFKYLGDNIESMWAALKAGNSIVNPQTVHVAWDNRFGDFIRTPTRVIIGMDEFTKVANYRARIRARSLRMGRDAGLTGDALENYVNTDLKSAFDENTGIALVPEALKYGETAAMSAPLEGAFGRQYQQLMETSTLARMITPFVKAPINMFNYAWAITPGLNRFNAQARAILDAGGEEAAVLHAKSTIAGGLYSYGAIQSLQGNLTGRGPSDPVLRKEWLKDNQPYSVKVGGTWVSYKRTDPIGMPLGLIADAVTFGQELDHGKDADAGDYAVAVTAALTSALSNRTYLQGLTEFSKAWSQGDPNSAGNWLRNFAASAVVPGALDALNPDTTMREVQSMGDAIMARIPGYSEKLDPKFDIWGEPVTRNGVFQRGVNPFALRDVGHSINGQLLTIGKGFPTPPTQEFGGQLDLSDKSWDTQKVGKSPYARWMELVSQSSLKSDAKEMMDSPDWKEMSKGTDQYKGGEQYLRMAGLIERHYSAARRQMESEYPTLATEARKLRRMQGAAVRGGDSGVAQVQSLFGR